MSTKRGRRARKWKNKINEKDTREESENKAENRITKKKDTI